MGKVSNNGCMSLRCFCGMTCTVPEDARPLFMLGDLGTSFCLLQTRFEERERERERERRGEEKVATHTQHTSELLAVEQKLEWNKCMLL